MLHKQLYEYNKPEAIICSHPWAAPQLLQPHELSSCSPDACHLHLLLCLRASPAQCATCTHVSGELTPLTVSMKKHVLLVLFYVGNYYIYICKHTYIYEAVVARHNWHQFGQKPLAS